MPQTGMPRSIPLSVSFPKGKKNGREKSLKSALVEQKRSKQAKFLKCPPFLLVQIAAEIARPALAVSATARNAHESVAVLQYCTFFFF